MCDRQGGGRNPALLLLEANGKRAGLACSVQRRGVLQHCRSGALRIEEAETKQAKVTVA